ncbi:hypothetical protein E8E11_005070 [Didymella keratinophila]|nr:hypothetical protein E8E11_005070 [Didymella keratinophila]
MTLRSRPEDDDWQHVKDAKKRKQVQDRLAQRARRQQLAAFCDGIKSGIGQRLPRSILLDSSRLADRSYGYDIIGGHSPLLANENMSELGLSILDTSPTSTYHSHSEFLPANLYSPLPSPTRTQLIIPLNVFTALFLNGNILSLICGAELAGKSLPPTPSTPIPLRPTHIQLTTVHCQWIDRSPFPKLRDSLIRLQGVIDQQDFLNDIFVMPSFEIKTGAESWDPRAWKMEGAWARKWGWLFF